ncbi:SH3 domain-containing protein [Streptococcus thoraltensis]
MTLKSKFTTASALALILTGTALSTGQSVAQAAVLGDNYPIQWRTGWGADSWGMYKRQCTSFVAFRLSSANGFTLPGGYGNAISWGGVARSQGYRVDMNPAVGSVAWFGNGVNGAGGYGHVAWVADVKGDTVTIEEYNYDYGQGPEKYWKRSFHKSNVSGYIHFKDLGPASVAKPTTSPVGTSNSTASSGTYHFTSRASIKAEPKMASPELAHYEKGQAVIYDKTLEADGYKWISYIAGSGMRRYIPISPLQKAQTSASTAPETTTPKADSKPIASSGTYQFTSRSSIKNEPKQAAAEIAFYDKGQSVHYDKTVEADGYKWISYISGSGIRRYIAVEKLATKTSSSQTSKTKTQNSASSTTIAVGDTISFVGTFKVTANISGSSLTSSSDLAGGRPSALNYFDPTPVIETDKSGKKSGDQILYPGEYFSIPGKYKVLKVDKASNGICVKIGSRDTWVTMSKVRKQ